MPKYLKYILVVFLALQPLVLFAQSFAPGMEPGTRYREYTISIPLNSRNWRVTDPDSLFEERAGEFLPNPVLEIPGVSLEGATRAELTIDFWSGHEGTVDKKIRFNDFKKWNPLQEALAGTETDALHYLAQYNITVPVPLSDLVEGTNTVRGTCGDNPWGWGQWGWYALTLRVHISDTKGATAAPRIMQINTDDPSGLPQFKLAGETAGIQRVDYLAAYEGVDEDGDGSYRDYHGMYRYGAWTGHVGSTDNPSRPVVWDTERIPDQKRPVKVIARIQYLDSEWFVLKPIEGVELNQRDYLVSIFHPQNRPVVFWVRNDRVSSCVVGLPLDFDTSRIADARMFLRTWNVENNEQDHTPFRINHGDWQENITGPGHQFHMEYYAIPFNDLKAGPNLFTFHSTTHHHGCEFLWPGPQLLLKLKKPSKH